jgi:ATP-binding cassette, subfamily F, member 3
MIEINVSNLTKYYGASKIFETISFEVKTGERIGLIGQNGCGKTTIMKILMGQEDCLTGEINFRKGIKVGYLNQIPEYSEEVTTIDVLQMAFAELYGIKKQMITLEESFTNLAGSELDDALMTYGKLAQRYELEGGYELETKINKISEGLKITEKLINMEFNKLSGGEKTRVILGKILLEQPDILLLDEPTNHLDLETISWFEGFLKEYKGSVLIISHDRYFLDSVVNKIIELEYSRANVYHGNYSYYVLEKERRFLIEYNNYINQQKKIERMEEQIKRYRVWGEMRDSEKMFKKAKELEKRLEKIDVMDRPLLNQRKVRFSQDTIQRTGKIVLSIEEVSKSFGEQKLLKDINITLFYQDSACIIGKNGCGKTTLLKMVLGDLLPDSGIIKLGSQVKIGYLPQQVIFEDEEQTILEYFSWFHQINYELARFQLARVLFFKEDVNKKIKYLSGGEKSRLRLCSLTFEKVNFMILDEPTNHLDIDSREVLEETLCEYDGTLLFVSHDRYFINKVADKILVIENRELKVYPGGYTAYLEEYQKSKLQDNVLAIEVKTSSKSSVSDSNRSKVKPQKIVNNIVLKLAEKESEIENLELKLKTLENNMEECNTNPECLKELYFEKEIVEQQLEKAYEEWEIFQGEK